MLKQEQENEQKAGLRCTTAAHLGHYTPAGSPDMSKTSKSRHTHAAWHTRHASLHSTTSLHQHSVRGVVPAELDDVRVQKRGVVNNLPADALLVAHHLAPLNKLDCHLRRMQQLMGCAHKKQRRIWLLPCVAGDQDSLTVRHSTCSPVCTSFARMTKPYAPLPSVLTRSAAMSTRSSCKGGRAC